VASKDLTKTTSIQEQLNIDFKKILPVNLIAG
jgi:hypothetical protein